MKGTNIPARVKPMSQIYNGQTNMNTNSMDPTFLQSRMRVNQIQDNRSNVSYDQSNHPNVGNSYDNNNLD